MFLNLSLYGFLNSLFHIMCESRQAGRAPVYYAIPPCSRASRAAYLKDSPAPLCALHIMKVIEFDESGCTFTREEVTMRQCRLCSSHILRVGSFFGVTSDSERGKKLQVLIIRYANQVYGEALFNYLKNESFRNISIPHHFVNPCRY